MTMFASKACTSLGCTCYWTDPKTWFTHYGAVEPGSQMEPNYECFEHFPHDQHNQPNVVITGIRRLLEESGGIHRDPSAFWLDAARYLTGGTHVFDEPIQPGMSAHARKVFTRLAAFTKENA